jgi:hypothetical protein
MVLGHEAIVRFCSWFSFAKIDQNAGSAARGRLPVIVKAGKPHVSSPLSPRSDLGLVYLLALPGESGKIMIKAAGPLNWAAFRSQWMHGTAEASSPDAISGVAPS